MSHFESQLSTKDGSALYYQAWEAEEPVKAVICLVHGLGEHSGRYSHVAGAVNMSGYHVMAFDLFGHGKSQGKRGDIPTFDVMNSHVSTLLEESAIRYPGPPQILYGHSLGGLIVLYYCLTIKPRLSRVVVTSPGLCTALEEQKAKMMMVKLLGSLLPGLCIPSGLDPKNISRDLEVVNHYIKDPLVHDQASLGFAKNSFASIRYIFDHVSEWSLPLLLMHGTDDKLAYSKCTEKISKVISPELCTLRLWTGLSHELHNEPEKADVLAFLIDYLDRFNTNIA